MHDDVVPDLETVAERNLDEMERLEVPPAPREDPPGQHAPELHPQVHVLAQETLVEHLPKPDQRLYAVVPVEVGVDVILRFERDVVRVHLVPEDLAGLPGAAREIDLLEDPAAELVSVGGGVGELFLQRSEPPAVAIFAPPSERYVAKRQEAVVGRVGHDCRKITPPCVNVPSAAFLLACTMS